jgi:methylenetetrahydrofolate dehydrogenase (NADP+)/methenyltetrahydrofolate cyclohydrolase
MAKATLIDGKAMAADLTAEITQATADLVAKNDLRPGLAVVIVGEDPASQVYVRNKKRTAESCGFHSVQHTLSGDVTQDDVLAVIDELNADPAIHGILVQLPLPKQLDEMTITQSIVPQKDVDGFHFENIGRLTSGNIETAFVPCTPSGCMLMVEKQLGNDLSGLNAVVIGRSNIVGKPLASLLLKSNATVTICHSRTKDLPQIARNADILVAAVGQEGGEKKSKLTGDVDFAAAIEVAGAITPVPGGVGPMTIAMLMSNTLRSAQRSLNPEFAQ